MPFLKNQRFVLGDSPSSLKESWVLLTFRRVLGNLDIGISYLDLDI